MKKIVWLSAVLFMSIAGICSCTEKNVKETEDHNSEDHDSEENNVESDHTESIHFSEVQAERAELKVEIVKSSDFVQTIKCNGEVTSAQGDEVRVVATANGVISFLKSGMYEGSMIKKGEIIINISSHNLVDGDPTKKAEMAYETAKKEYERDEDLVKDQIISVEKFEQTRLRYETAKLAYEGLAENQSADGVLIKSPMTAYLKRLIIKEGDFVSVGDPLAIISKNKRLQLRVDVPIKYRSQLSQVYSARFRSSYESIWYSMDKLNGKILSFGQSSQGSLYIPIYFEIDAPSQLLSGSFVEVYLLSENLKNVVSLPKSALTEDQGVFFVYEQISVDEYERREVKLGFDNGERVQILSGIESNSKIVVQGAYQIKLASISSEIPEGHSH